MATIRKRQLKNGGNAYTVQVKFKDKGSGKTILETTTWRPDGKMTAKWRDLNGKILILTRERLL